MLIHLVTGLMKSDARNETLWQGTVKQSAKLLCGAASPVEYILAEEVALSLNYNGISYAVMMVTPCDLADFVTGFSLTSGVISHSRELYNVLFTEHDGHVNAEIEIANRAFWALKSKRRQLAGTSGCGLCGVEAIENALPELTPLTPVSLPQSSVLNGLRDVIRSAQVLAQESGAVHAALYLDRDGQVLECREDIGRHNALDKLIGALTTSKSECVNGMVVLTSRCSLELVQKAIIGRLPLLVTLSAPTALSVAWAKQYGLTLIHLPKRDEPRVYSPG